jgi:hypothetical protein
MEFIGSFHIAEYYTINNDADNKIKIRPVSKGYLKILI